MNYEQRNTKYERRGFTLIELVVAIGLLMIVILFAGTIFKSSIGSYRIAMAQAEIMNKLRVITQQLDSDFQGLQKDGYLVLYCENIPNRIEYPGASAAIFRADWIYYFSTGDFQSWYNPDIRSNIARIYLGHEYRSLFDTTIYVNHWRLAHDTLLLSPGTTSPPYDVNNTSYAGWKANPTMVLNDANVMPPEVNVASDPNTLRLLFCENAGQFAIDWTDGSRDSNSAIAWFGLTMPRKVGELPSIPADTRYNSIEPVDPPSSVLYRAIWLPSTSADLWPKALKFTFTLYDSRGVFKEGQTFTHIVYLGE
jgi:prepilin-type N-terminal cleavage/methylation domain-containing protein